MPMPTFARSAVLLAVFALACGRVVDPVAPVSDEAALATSKAAVLAIGVAAGGEGHSFFDNFLPCPRRGVIDYRNTTNGRRATFTGCDAGDGVIVDGTVDLAWTPPGGDRSRITSITIGRGLEARIGGAPPQAVAPFQVAGIAFPSSEPSVLAVAPAPLRVQFGSGTVAPLDARATPAAVFAPMLTIDALPNAANALSALGDTDVKRLAYHGAVALASLLFDETLETQRGDHVHQLPCGTLSVVQNAATRLPRLDNAWTAACDLTGGLHATGTFTLQWTEFDATAGRLTMIVQGPLTFGGGVPRITLSRLEWSISSIATLPSTARISGKLVSGTTERAFSFDLVVDD
jgi:hypothetical protein